MLQRGGELGEVRALGEGLGVVEDEVSGTLFSAAPFVASVCLAYTMIHVGDVIGYASAPGSFNGLYVRSVGDLRGRDRGRGARQARREEGAGTSS